MRSRTWGLLIVIIILAAVVLTILLVWGGAPESDPPLPTQTTGTSPLPTPATAASAPTAVPPTQAPTPAPLVYTVRDGDTLSSIAQTYGVSVQDIIAANSLANPDMLTVGQQLAIPGHFITPAAPPTSDAAEPSPSESPPTVESVPPSPVPTLTPSGPPVVEIRQVLGPGTLAAEVVIVHNRGGLVSLEEWTLSDTEGNSFTFPSFTLFTNGEVRVHSTVGQNTPTDLYWSLAAPAWHNGELVTLKDAGGNRVDTYIVP
jgi:LysM repeat protein